MSAIAGPLVDTTDRLAKRNALVLAVAQALAGGNSVVIVGTAGIVGGAADACAKAAPDTGAAAPRSRALAVRGARRDIALTDLSTEFRVTVASRSMISSRIAFWFDASLPQRPAGPSKQELSSADLRSQQRLVWIGDRSSSRVGTTPR